MTEEPKASIASQNHSFIYRTCRFTPARVEPQLNHQHLRSLLHNIHYSSDREGLNRSQASVTGKMNRTILQRKIKRPVIEIMWPHRHTNILTILIIKTNTPAKLLNTSLPYEP